MNERHLLYHLYPVGEWRQSLALLAEYRHLFNGVKLATVAQGDGAFAIHRMNDELDLFDVVFEVKNNLHLREVLGLRLLLEKLQERTSKGIAFFGHAKGVSYRFLPTGSEKALAIKLWAEACYRKNLDDIEQVEEALRGHSIAGCFRQLATSFENFPPNCPWCFAGTFFWFDVAKMFERDWHSALKQHRYGAEAFPGFAFPIEDSACLFGESSGSLYKLENIRALLAEEKKNAR
jgi:hypothetical protein